jgi:hypothetical protein
MRLFAVAWIPACLFLLLPVTSAQEPVDAGAASADAGTPQADAGAPLTEPGAPPADAGVAALAPTVELGPPVAVVFQVNDSLVKDKALGDAKVELRASEDAAPMFRGNTGPDGKLALQVPAGRWLVTYTRPGYVTVERSPTEITAEGQVITTTLTMLLESTGQTGQRRIQIVLNWGSSTSQVKDADSHLACPCSNEHVYFANKTHSSEQPKHDVSLDVDDMDWGGPETITVLDPPAGEYVYWVHNYSGDATLGESGVVVRVVLDDVLAGEYPIPGGWSREDWRPFKAIAVGADKSAQIVPFSPEELEGDVASQIPASLNVSDSCTGCDDSCVSIGVVSLIILFWIVSALAKRR